MKLDEIPELDLGPFRADERSDAARVFVERLRAVCHEHGFFYLAGHGIDPERNAELQTLAQRFFARPESERLEIANVHSPQFRDTPVGHEYTRGMPDRREQLDISRELAAPVLRADDPAWLRLRGPNLWPRGVPELEPAVAAWIADMEKLGRTLCRALAAALEQPLDIFGEMVSPHPEVLVKIIRYPGAESRGAEQGVGQHRDTGLITFVLQDTNPGLQVRLDDRWVAIAPRAGTFVVNLGEMMQLLTRGYFAATVHRVVSPAPDADRLSIAYFFNPKLEATLAPLPLAPEFLAAAPGGESDEPDNPIFANYGDNSLKVRIRAHPDVARRHHADLLTDLSESADNFGP